MLIIYTYNTHSYKKQCVYTVVLNIDWVFNIIHAGLYPVPFGVKGTVNTQIFGETFKKKKIIRQSWGTLQLINSSPLVRQ